MHGCYRDNDTSLDGYTDQSIRGLSHEWTTFKGNQ
jgi:hypothetical protein